MSNIIKGSGIIYTTGQPNTIPSVGTDAEFAIDINGIQYAWNRDSGVWDNIGQGIEISNSNAVPSNTPTKFKPRFVVTPDRTLYFYSGSWGKVNPLPSGLFSSSAQIGNTGIYSGSGWLNGTTIVDNLGAFPFRVENVGNDEDFKFILNPSNEIFIGQVNGSSIYITSDPHMIIGSSNNFMLFDPIGSYSGGPGIKVQDWNPEPKGIEYIGDYNTHIKTNDRSIPDVGTIRNHLTASYALNANVDLSRTGIYSGSGTLRSTTIVNNSGIFPFIIEDSNDPTNFKFVMQPFGDMTMGLPNGPNISIAKDPYMIIGSGQHGIAFDTSGSWAGYDRASIVIYDDNPEPRGLEYASDYNTFITRTDRSIPDVGTIRNHLTASYANNGRNYKVLSFFILQETTSVIDVTEVLENDYGLVNFSSTRAATGIYTLNVGYDYFTTKTVVISNIPSVSDGGGKILRVINNSANTIVIFSYDLEGNLADINNDQEYPNSCFIEIRTYG